MADDPLDQAEEDVTATVGDVLDEVAAEFAASLADATELVAARFSVSRISRMFTGRMPRIVRRLLGVAEQGVDQAAADVDAAPPEGWDDLPARYDDGTLPEPMSAYVETTEHLLRAVGDRLAEVAREELAAGVDAGEDIDQLRDRLAARFAREGGQLGPGREQLISRTEAARAWNTGTLEVGRALTGPDRPIVKQWRTRRDPLVRDTHDAVDGQLRLLDEPFTVAGVSMQAPGDPTAPAAEVCNCRCRLVLEKAPAAASAAPAAPAVPWRDPAFTPEAAAILATWDNPFHRPRVPAQSQAASAGPAFESTVQAAAVEHTGAMIALLPTAEDAERLALDGDGAEPAEELHVTLWYLGEGAPWTEDQRNELIGNVRAEAANLAPFTANIFGANHWNPGSDSPSWVWAVGDNRDTPDDTPSLAEVQGAATYALENTHERPDVPTQHSPWSPHVCAAYSADTWPLEPMTERVGEIHFDRIRVAFAGEHTDIPLGTGNEEQEKPMNDPTAAAPAVLAEAPPEIRTWSNPDDTALAFEDTETGDGRVFTPGALKWESGPWPLQYADEMLMGHQGAELAGAIDTVSRDANRITGSGPLYLNRPAGADAVELLEQGAPLGVSVDLDNVSVQFVDRTIQAGDEVIYASAVLPTASVLSMEDGSVLLSTAVTERWTASGVAFTRSRTDMQLMTDARGGVTAAAIVKAFGSGVLTAAAGDASDPDVGVVVHEENAGDFLMRITDARFRGATLVAMPAYADARIVLDPVEETAAARPAPTILAASADTLERVIAYVTTCPAAVGPRGVSKALGVSMTTARNCLTTAARDGRLVRLAAGLYAAPCSLPEGLPVTAAAETPEHGVPAGMAELEASAWRTMQDADPMPAEWFREPTAEELPPGSGGVHYREGRVFGWVAQAGEPHAGFPGRRLTIESLGRIDLSHFLRARFALDDGNTVRVGAFTMNVPHNRDGAECNDEVCQFDDSRTVAGIVTVGMSKGGMWFSGAAAPWLSEWDRHVFNACQPSYHLKQARTGGKGWELRAVLSVPVPGHSSPLVATAVTERANLALAASAAYADIADSLSTDTVDTGDTVSTPGGVHAAGLPGQRGDTMSTDLDLDAVTAALLSDGNIVDRLVDALAERTAARQAERRAEIEALSASMALTPDEITASATPAAPQEGTH